MKRILWLLALPTALLLVVSGLFWWALRGSLPTNEGKASVPGLTAQVEILFDAKGVPLVRGETLEDALCAQGYLHARDRFFQIDLIRRSTGGELAELLGSGAAEMDREARVLQLRPQAERTLRELPAPHRRILQTYTGCLNAGLSRLRTRPPEYLLLRERPQPWTEADTLLVLYGMFRLLSNNDLLERMVATMQEALPRELVEFLTPDLSRWDTPAVPECEAPEPWDYEPAPLPGPDAVDLRRRPEPDAGRSPGRVHGDLSWGSNSWAVSGGRTADGGPLLANDPHLPLQVPNIWYPLELEWAGRRAGGGSIPGVPGVLIGVSSDLAWGITAALGDQMDLVVVEVDPENPSRYRTPEGWEPFRTVSETIPVRGEEPVPFEVRWTRWGPVVDEDLRGRPLALRSPLYDPGGLTLGYLDFLTFRSVEEVIQATPKLGGPTLNLLITDGDGRIAWTVSGFLPRRRGFDGKVPVSWVDPEVGWEGPLEESLRPKAIDPPSGLILTANQRTVSVETARRLSRSWAPPTRARRIADVLGGRDGLTPKDFLELQLDARSLVHDPIRDLVLELVPPEEENPALRRARESALEWDETAGADQTAFHLLQVFKEALRERLLAPLLEPVLESDPEFVFDWPLAQETVMRILEERPEHFLPRDQPDWESFLRSVLRDAVAESANHGVGSPLEVPWGEVNRARIHHPLAPFLPLGTGWLNMLDDPLPGWPGSVRAQSPSYGPSLRLVARPGNVGEALFHMPGGVSGHFLSPHYRAGHADWVEGRAVTLREEPVGGTLTLVPTAGASSVARPAD